MGLDDCQGKSAANPEELANYLVYLTARFIHDPYLNLLRVGTRQVWHDASAESVRNNPL